MTCKRCHRVLKNPLSVTHGYGPTCWKKVQRDVEREMQERAENQQEPNQN